MERDAFVDAVFAEAGLPILHIEAARAYVPEEIAAWVSRAIGGEPLAASGAL